MQTTTTLYNQIVANPNHWFEPQLSIYRSSDTISSLSKDKLFSITTTKSAFADGVPQIGCAVAGEIEASFIAPTYTIPKMAKVRLMVRACTATQNSEYIYKGYYYIDTREVSHNDDGLDVVKIHGYDAMLLFEQPYPSDDQHDYPLLDVTMLQFMASAAGVDIDQRTLDIMDDGYMFSLPAGYTMREMLGFIASAYGGNFIITDEGKLLLIQLGGTPTETFYLVDESDNAITFGGNRILV